jgi:hypothetical protein
MGIKEAKLCFVVYEKEGKVFFAFGSKIQVPSTSKQFIHGWKGKNILQGMDTFTEQCLIPKLQYLEQRKFKISLRAFCSSFISIRQALDHWSSASSSCT